jgi:heme/copper-type cytochrome/quinol oxidase subunit 4
MLFLTSLAVLIIPEPKRPAAPSPKMVGMVAKATLTIISTVLALDAKVCKAMVLAVMLLG